MGNIQHQKIDFEMRWINQTDTGHWAKHQPVPSHIMMEVLPWSQPRGTICNMYIYEKMTFSKNIYLFDEPFGSIFL